MRLVALPDGTLLVEEGPDGSLDPLAALVERSSRRRTARAASRQVDDVWAVQATRIEVVALPDAPDGETIDLTRNDGTTTLAVDGRQVFGSLPALEQRGEREGARVRRPRGAARRRPLGGPRGAALSRGRIARPAAGGQSVP